MLTITRFATPLLLITLLSACGEDKGIGKHGAPGGGMSPPEVEVITVSTSNATITQDLPGRLQAFRTAQVRARVEGVIEKRLFQEGSEVKSGKALFQIDARTYKAEAESARAELAVARHNVARYKLLLEGNAVSQLDYDLAAAKAKQAEAALSQAEEALENASVPAAISGYIGRSLVTEGAFVGRGEATLLATIEQLDPIYANFTQSGSDLLRLRQAVKAGKLKHADSADVDLVLEDGSTYPHKGEIFFTDMAVNPSTGSVSLRARFPNPDRELLPGMFVRVRFPESIAENVIRIPQRSVQGDAQGQFVMVVGTENKVMLNHVTTGDMIGDYFIIESGLKAGEQVIVNGLQKARPGTVVTPVPVGGTTPVAHKS